MPDVESTIEREAETLGIEIDRIETERQDGDLLYKIFPVESDGGTYVVERDESGPMNPEPIVLRIEQRLRKLKEYIEGDESMAEPDGEPADEADGNAEPTPRSVRTGMESEREQERYLGGGGPETPDEYQTAGQKIDTELDVVHERIDRIEDRLDELEERTEAVEALREALLGDDDD